VYQILRAVLKVFGCADYSRQCSTTPRQILPVAALSNKDGTKLKDQTELKQVSSVLLKLFGGGTLEPEWSKAEKQQAFRTLQKVKAIFAHGLSQKYSYR
jgi:hypothetical protein